MKYKKIMFLIISLVLFININKVLAEEKSNVNISTYNPRWGNSYASEIERKAYKIARISLWDITDNTLIDRKNICDIEPRTSQEFIFVSNLTKVEIAKYNGKLPKVIEDSMDEDISNNITMYNKRISLPNLIIERGQDTSAFSNNIISFFENKTNLDKIRLCFDNFTEDKLNKWNNRELCIVVEPMISLVSQSGILWWSKEKITCFTTAEIGVITNQEAYRDMFRMAGAKNYAESCYKALPFSCFKIDEGTLNLIPPYDTSTSDGLCDPHNTNDMLDMIESLGCFELVSDGTPLVVEATKSEITKSADLIYYTNSWVITSVNVSSVKGFPYQSKTPGTAEDRGAKNNCLSGNGKAKITYNFDTDVEYYNNSNVNEIAIPENGNAVSWLKWRCPDEECYIQIEIKTNSDDAIPDVNIINIQVIDPITNKYPPNTEATDRNDYFTQPSVAYGDWKISDNKSLEWITYDYEWHYDWHYICRNSYNSYECLNEINENEYNQYGSSGGYSLVEEETNSGKTRLVRDYWHICNSCSCNFVDVGENHKCKICSFNKEDWGWVEWKERKHEITINAKNPILKRSKNSPNSNESDTSIKSGYGIEFSIDTNIKYTNNGIKQNVSEAKDMVVPLQFMEVFLPEYYYEEYEITTFNDLDENGYKEENIFTLPKNPYSQFEQNCHFTPIWYPDGKYVIGVKLNKCYCPGGELNICYDDIYINIEGNAYDDWHIAPK